MAIDIAAALSALYDEVSPGDFYRDVFPVGSLEEKGIQVPGGYTGIAVSIPPGSRKVRRWTITDDLDVLDELAATDDFCLISPISYAGKARKSENARFMYAMVIDLDGIRERKHWDILLEQIKRGRELHGFYWGLPCPTYLVSSGTGIHIYYVFERPIPMFHNIVEQLEILKKRLTWQAWTQGASALVENIQYESLFQGFRMVGTIAKTGTRCRAFKVGEKVTVEYLNEFVPEKYQAPKFAYKSELLLSDAKEKYPEWYQARIVEGKKKGTWVCKKDLYDWWIRRVVSESGAKQGHRYWCVMTLATYAKKCGVSKEQLEEDAYGLIPFLDGLGDTFDENDVRAALHAYDDSYITYPIHAITARTGIAIQKNKRNGRPQAQHLKGARAIQAIADEFNGTNWRDGNGRPDKADQVRAWRKAHPDGKKADCIRDTGLSKKTVYKWWNEGGASNGEKRR